MGTSSARWVLLATVLGSGMTYLDGTIVNVALPRIASDLDAGITGLQWVLDAYLVTLTSLLLLGGSLGDRFGRVRMFRLGILGFTAASVACGLAPTIEVLIVARAAQGVGAALLVPGSLAILGAVFHPDDRARAVGAWSGLGGVAAALGPFLGGWLVDGGSWRWGFIVNAPLSVVVLLAARNVPETRVSEPGSLDRSGALAAVAGLALATYGLIEQSPLVAVVGLAVFVAFLVIEARSPSPMLPLELFRSRQFSGTNLATFAVWASLNGAFFLLVLELQLSLGYSALEAGSALLPATGLLVVLSARAGALSTRIGPRVPMTVGPLLVSGGLLLWSGVDAGDTYVRDVLPGAILFGLGLALTVAPLTATIMASVDEDHLGVGSAVNNAVSRVGGLMAVAVLPALVGLDTAGDPASLDVGVDRALVASGVLAALGAVIAFVTVRRGVVVAHPMQPALTEPCGDPALVERRPVGAPWRRGRRAQPAEQA